MYEPKPCFDDLFKTLICIANENCVCLHEKITLVCIDSLYMFINIFLMNQSDFFSKRVWKYLRELRPEIKRIFLAYSSFLL